MHPLGLSQNKLARVLGVDAARINRIVAGKSRISADTALRLSRYFGTSAQLWMNLQAKYDLEVAKNKNAKEIEEKVRIHPGVDRVATA